MTTSVIVGGARTPFGAFLGSLKSFTASQLGALAIQGALQKANLSSTAVEYVIMGQVLTAGAGQIPARQAAIAAGIPWTVPALTVNKVCLSGINAIALADQLIRAGEYDIIVAGGQESMTNAPHLLPHSRSGYRYGDVTIKDHLAYDGLTDIYTDMLMGRLTEECNKTIEQYSRTQQDEFACQSHHKAAQAWKDHVFDEEVIPVSITTKKTTTELCYDECIRESTTMDSLGQLKPVFESEGTITAGSASPISDGAAAVVVMSKTKAEQLGLSWWCEIGAHGVVAGPDSTLQHQPADAILKATSREGITSTDCDLVEINEAFAAVGLASMDKLGLDPAKVNIHGGAIAMGHPLATSGARMVLHLARQLSTRSGGYAVAALCGGGGQGDALILRG